MLLLKITVCGPENRSDGKESEPLPSKVAPEPRLSVPLRAVIAEAKP